VFQPLSGDKPGTGLKLEIAIAKQDLNVGCRRRWHIASGYPLQRVQ
jgi:hypothetical protein